ncbi:protease-4 [Methanohalophilus levihalophilus]|uniref:signal peptide peptidase SppA n=1 Tax=Methanohalophilus levihalophilus TaxID=1431282 RepID=UPI001AEAA04A|nr:signal peptide peptidase SppA [Methanohalophilus levihalophilus]MBP2030025.1 protease-4 [Methanohalophilus levihalophilus]
MTDTDNPGKTPEEGNEPIQEEESASYSYIEPEDNSEEFSESYSDVYTEIEDEVPGEEVDIPPVELVPDEADETIPPFRDKPVLEKPAYTPPPQQPKNNSWVKYVAIVAVLFMIIFASFAAIIYSFDGDIYSSGDRVAVIYLQGTMVTGSVPAGFGYATSEDISESIREALDDESVKAIVLRVNSPGGSPAAGEEIYNEINRAQDLGVPVVVSMGDLGASAAYHASSASDVIVVNPNTITGSIGVIWTFVNMSAYYEEEGIEYYIAKSGEFKDMGGSWRGLTDEEKAYADEVINESFELFVADVAEGRNMTVDEVKEIADGRIYTGTAAKRIGLVDEFGSLYDAIDIAAELGGIEGEPDVYYVNRPSLTSLLFGSESTSEDVKGFVSYYEDSPFGVLRS